MSRLLRILNRKEPPRSKERQKADIYLIPAGNSPGIPYQAREPNIHRIRWRAGPGTRVT